MAAPRFHRLVIADVRRETADAVSISFSVPPALADAYAFEPGQYLTLKAPIGGEEVRRSYSICAAPADNELRIAVKRVEGGVFSPWAAETLEPGHKIDVMTPVGRFGAAALKLRTGHVLGIAAGSGITPILSILKTVLAAHPESRFTLFYGNRTTHDILFREALEDLKDRHLTRLSIFHVLSREEQDLPILHGRLDAGKLRLLLRHTPPIGEAFVCGPAGLNGAAETLLREAGIAFVNVERFVSESGGLPRARTILPQVPDARPVTVNITADGKRRSVPVQLSESILDAALRAGLDLPYACKGGMCTTCRAKVVAGKVRMALNYSLEPWELAAGFVLTCQSHPEGDGVVVDFDAV